MAAYRVGRGPDPADVDRWPYRHTDLQDDRWATALHLSPQATTV